MKPIVRSALVSVLDSCSVGCKFCFRADKGGNAVTPEVLSRVFSRLSEIGVETITLTGGEPLEHPDIRKLVEISKPFPIAISLITAARHQDTETILENISAGLSLITLSADSFGAMRVGGTARSLADAIAVAIKLPQISIVIHIIAFQLEIDELVMARDCAKNFMHVSFEFSPLNLSRTFRIKHGMGKRRYVETILQDVKLMGEFFTLDFEFHAKLNRLINYIDQPKLLERANCGSHRVYVTSSGELRKCPYSKTSQVSVFSPRSEIKQFFVNWERMLVQREAMCVGICH